MSLKFVPPTKETPGFLRRLARALEFAEALQAGKLSPELVYGLADFLSDFIVDTPKDQARELLLDASEQQFTEMLNAVMGVQRDAVPLQSSD